MGRFARLLPRCHAVRATASAPKLPLRTHLRPGGAALSDLRVRRRIVAAIMQLAVIRAMQEALGLPAAAPAVASVRGPPEWSRGAPAE
jgi:hypothetical protein